MKLLEVLKSCKNLYLFIYVSNRDRKSSTLSSFWESFDSTLEGFSFSGVEGLFAILYFILISKEKYSAEIPLLCAELYSFLALSSFF